MYSNLSATSQTCEGYLFSKDGYSAGCEQNQGLFSSRNYVTCLRCFSTHFILYLSRDDLSNVYIDEVYTFKNVWSVEPTFPAFTANMTAFTCVVSSFLVYSHGWILPKSHCQQICYSQIYLLVFVYCQIRVWSEEVEVVQKSILHSSCLLGFRCPGL